MMVAGSVKLVVACANAAARFRPARVSRPTSANTVTSERRPPRSPGTRHRSVSSGSGDLPGDSGPAEADEHAGVVELVGQRQAEPHQRRPGTLLPGVLVPVA